MNFSEALQKFFSGPVELLMETIVSLGPRVNMKPGTIIVFLSLIINVSALLLYRWADLYSESKESEAGGTGSSFLRKIPLSLCVEILLFIPAYIFFGNFNLIRKSPYAFIPNLAQPDMLLTLGSIRLSILPICALAARILTNVIRLKNADKKTAVFHWAVTFIFFGILWVSSSAFALYRLIAELLLLGSTLLSKMKNSQWILSIGLSVIGAAALVYTQLFLGIQYNPRKRLVIIAALLLLQVPLLITLLSKNRRSTLTASKGDTTLFLVNAVFLTILTGIQIPSTVIQSAPTDFINISFYHSPVWYILSSFLLAAGTFIFWFGLIYKIAPAPVRKVIGLILTVLSCWSTINSTFFGNNRGIMTSQLKYELMPEDPLGTNLINFGILVLTAVILYIVWKNRASLLTPLILLLCLMKMTSSVTNMISIVTTLDSEKALLATQIENMPEIPLSKTGKNVIVMMLDRAVGYYAPYIMAERPELREQFDGFTFYPNTISFASSTNEGSPALFGGYEYTPEKINSRSDVPLVQKHDEALRLLPILFDDAGYEVTIIDPPYAGYQMLSNLSIFSDRPNLHTYLAEGLFTTSETSQQDSIRALNRNFYYYSLYRSAPLFIQPTLYSSGTYNQVNLLQVVDNLFQAEGIRIKFEEAYNVLLNLPNITNITDEDTNTYLAIGNRTTHEPVLLQMPDYVPSDTVNNTAFESSPITRTGPDGETVELNSIYKITHYHVNMAAFLQVGKWLDWLRENDVYDNTRIIITADHGMKLGYDELKVKPMVYEEILSFNPIFMVKDFDSKGFTVDTQFMTNADTPTIALEGLIDDPVNPATGEPVNNNAKTSSDILIKFTEVWDIRKNQGNTFFPGNWYRFQGEDIFDQNNWELLGRH